VHKAQGDIDINSTNEMLNTIDKLVFVLFRALAHFLQEVERAVKLNVHNILGRSLVIY
jgi:hypothetical protein